MRKSQLKTIINECIQEVLTEKKLIKKKKAIQLIKEIVEENDLELEEIFQLGKSAEEKYYEDVERLTVQYKELFNDLNSKEPSDDQVKKALEYAGKEDKYAGNFVKQGESKVIAYDSKSRNKIVNFIQKQMGGTGGQGSSVMGRE